MRKIKGQKPFKLKEPYQVFEKISVCGKKGEPVIMTRNNGVSTLTKR